MAEKLIEVYEQEILFKITGQTPLMYRAMFAGADFLKDFMNLEKAKVSGESFDSLEFYQMVYCLAKKGNPDIPEMNDWLDSFDEGFPVMDVFAEVLPLIQANFTAPKKKATRTTKK
ncbi:hypothetical protein [Lysinibacillus sp. NPDC086135]|uniref:hypothetical protein n=1 Tax=Lysinibacillus sp. NPDC086135 TaxID=3364130 RepID=UPI0038285561